MLSMEKKHDQFKTTHDIQSSEPSNFRVQQWKTDVLGHKGQF